MNCEEVPDYRTYVKEDKEMCLLDIVQKTQDRIYSSVTEFRADVRQILHNSRAYNSKGCGQHRSEGKLCLTEYN